MEPSRKRSAPTQKQQKKGKKAKVETGVIEADDASSSAPKCTSIEVSFLTDREQSDAVKQIGRVFDKSEAESKAIVNLAKTLQKDDPAVFITFRSDAEIRNSLRSTLAGTAAAANRPCPPGNNGNQAFQNLKNWVLAQLPNTGETIEDCTPRGLAIGNLTQDKYNALMLTLSFTQAPADQWGIANAANNRSLGGLIGITGTGVGAASITVLPSNAFRG